MRLLSVFTQIVLISRGSPVRSGSSLLRQRHTNRYTGQHKSCANRLMLYGPAFPHEPNCSQFLVRFFVHRLNPLINTASSRYVVCSRVSRGRPLSREAANEYPTVY